MKQVTAKTSTPSKNKKPRFTKLKSFLQTKPYLAFGLVVGVLALAIIASYILRTPAEVEETKVEKPLSVVVDNGQIHYVTAQAQLQKDDVVQIIAQTSGIVNKVNFTAGDQIKSGQAIINIASNYQGANVSAVQAQQAQVAYQNAQDTYQTQKDMIEINRQLALGQYDLSHQEKDWNQDTLTNTKSNIGSANDALRIIDQQVKALESLNPNDPNLITLKSTQLQITGSLTQAQSTLKNLEYTFNEDHTLSQSPEMQRDLALKQLEVQEKGLNLQLETARLTAQLTNIQASLAAPTTPFAGTIEKINVKKGDMISAGQVIAVVSAGDNQKLKKQALLNVSAPAATAQNYAHSYPAYLILDNGQKIVLNPEHISSVPTTGAAYNFYFSLSLELAAQLDASSYLTVSLPFQTQQNTKRLVPVDAVYQTQFNNYVYVVGPNEAGSPSAQIRELELGPVVGSMVTINSGLTDDDLVILNRQVKNNQWVSFE